MTAREDKGHSKDGGVETEETPSSPGPAGYFSDTEDAVFIKETMYFRVLDIGTGENVYECKFCKRKMRHPDAGRHFSKDTKDGAQCPNIDEYRRSKADAEPDTGPESGAETEPDHEGRPKEPIGIPEKGDPRTRPPSTPEAPLEDRRQRPMYRDEDYSDRDTPLPSLSPEEELVKELAAALEEQLQSAPGMTDAKVKRIPWVIRYFKSTSVIQNDPHALYTILVKQFGLDDDVINFAINEVMKIRYEYDNRPHDGFRPTGTRSPASWNRRGGFERERSYDDRHGTTQDPGARPDYYQQPPPQLYDERGYPVVLPPGYGQPEKSQSETFKDIMLEMDRRQADRDADRDRREAEKEKDDRVADIIENQNSLIEQLSEGPQKPEKSETELRDEIKRDFEDRERTKQLDELNDKISKMGETLRNPPRPRSEGEWGDDGARAVSEVGTAVVNAVSTIRKESVKTRNLLLRMAGERDMLGGRPAKRRTDERPPITGETGESSGSALDGLPDEYMIDEA